LEGVLKPQNDFLQRLFIIRWRFCVSFSVLFQNFRIVPSKGDTESLLKVSIEIQLVLSVFLRAFQLPYNILSVVPRSRKFVDIFPSGTVTVQCTFCIHHQLTGTNYRTASQRMPFRLKGS